MSSRIVPDQFALSNDALLARDAVHDAAQTLVDIYHDIAPAEALTRALVSERTGQRDGAIFWTTVFNRCLERASR